VQIRLFNSSNNNYIALRFIEVGTEQLIMPFMVGDDTEPELHYQIIQKIGSTETIVAQGFYPDGEYRLSNIIVDGSLLKLYINSVLWRTVSITPMTVNRLELSGGAKKFLVDEMFYAPYAAKESELEAWHQLERPFFDPDGVVFDEKIPSASKWDSKVTTFYEASQPSANAVGDIWYDTSDNNHPYRWDGNQWVDIQDKSPIPDERIPSADDWHQKARTFYQDTPPVASGQGDIWIDTSNFNHRYWWDGAKWADMSDTSPVDASQRPIHAQGLGGDIYFDKDGYRAVRKADGKIMQHFDLETGSNYWEGDGVFRGRVEASEGYFHGEVKSIDADGNYSVLDQARLRFYRRIGNEDVLSYYVAQIATGQAVDGQVVDLAALGYRFFEAPKVVLQPKLNRVFVANTTERDVWMDWDVENETFDPETGAASFKVRARTIIKGGTVFGNFSPNRLESEGSSTVTTTGPGTTYLRFRISGYAYDGAIFVRPRLQFRIRYRKSGTTGWIVLDTLEYTAAAHVELSPTNFSYNVPSSGSVGYDVQITVLTLSNRDGNPRDVPHLLIHEFEYRSGDTILSDPSNPEIVSWIAIDGG